MQILHFHPNSKMMHAANICGWKVFYQNKIWKEVLEINKKILGIWTYVNVYVTVIKGLKDFVA